MERNTDGIERVVTAWGYPHRINHPFLSVAAQRHPCPSVLLSVSGPKERRLSGALSASEWPFADAVERNTDERGYPRMNTDSVVPGVSARSHDRRFLNKINYRPSALLSVAFLKE